MPYMKKMQFATFRWMLNLFLALIIFLNAEAGRLLGIQWLSLHFSAVWPATGFALAALLIFGFRSWPGIFWGNFASNFLHLYLAGHGFQGPFIAALAITLGSLFQSLLGAWFIRKYCQPSSFLRVKDVVLFLLGGGIVTCIVASTIGVMTLWLYGGVKTNTLAFTWLTFWLGDTMGIYIFTPLLLVWALRRPEIGIRACGGEFILMILTFLCISFFTVRGDPLGYLFIPFNIWVTYRFGLHGATVMMVFITLATIIPIALGNGPFIVNFEEEILLIIVSFLEIIAVTSLLFGAVVEERNAAWQLLKSHKIELFEHSTKKQ